jgi:hypothetical protein
MVTSRPVIPSNGKKAAPVHGQVQAMPDTGLGKEYKRKENDSDRGMQRGDGLERGTAESEQKHHGEILPGQRNSP